MNDMKFKEHLVSGYDKQILKKYNSIRRGAHIRDIKFNLSFNEYLPFFNKPCYYCGDEGQISLDRLDSSLGYIKNNIVACCTACNVMKGTLSASDYIFQCKKITKRPKSYSVNLAGKSFQELMGEAEYFIIINTLELADFDTKRAIELLKISKATFYNKLNKHKTNIATLQIRTASQNETL